MSARRDPAGRHRDAPHRLPHPPSQTTASKSGLRSLAPAAPAALLAAAQATGRGNAPVRAAAIQRLQQTVGNRATRRLLAQPATPRRAAPDPRPIPTAGPPRAQGSPASARVPVVVQRLVALEYNIDMDALKSGKEEADYFVITKVEADRPSDFLSSVKTDLKKQAKKSKIKGDTQRRHEVPSDILIKYVKKLFKGKTLRQAAAVLKDFNVPVADHITQHSIREGLDSLVDKLYNWRANLWPGEGKENMARGLAFAQLGTLIKKAWVSEDTTPFAPPDKLVIILEERMNDSQIHPDHIKPAPAPATTAGGLQVYRAEEGTRLAILQAGNTIPPGRWKAVIIDPTAGTLRKISAQFDIAAYDQLNSGTPGDKNTLTSNLAAAGGLLDARDPKTSTVTTKTKQSGGQVKRVEYSSKTESAQFIDVDESKNTKESGIVWEKTKHAKRYTSLEQMQHDYIKMLYDPRASSVQAPSSSTPLPLPSSFGTQKGSKKHEKHARGVIETATGENTGKYFTPTVLDTQFPGTSAFPPAPTFPRLTTPKVIKKPINFKQLEKERARYRKERNTAQQEVADLKREVEEEQKKNTQLTTEKTTLRGDYKRARRESRTAKRRGTELEAKTTELEKKTTELEAKTTEQNLEITELKEKVQKEQKRRKRLRRQSTESRQEAENVKQERDTLLQEIADLKAQQEKDAAANQQLREEYESMGRKLKRARRKSNALEQQVTERDERIRQLHSEMEETAQQMGELQTEVQQLATTRDTAVVVNKQVARLLKARQQRFLSKKQRRRQLMRPHHRQPLPGQIHRGPRFTAPPYRKFKKKQVVTDQQNY